MPTKQGGRALKNADFVIDVRGGAGRISLPLALRCREVINVEPSPTMAIGFRTNAAGAGISNMRIIVGGATSAPISQRLQAAQARALRQHGVHPSGIPAGCSFSIGRHHSIFRFISVSWASRKISGFSSSRYNTIEFQSDETLGTISHWRHPLS
jgi:hypothetical protein